MTTPCEACNKSSLSLLLLRPSPIAKKGSLIPAGADTVQSVPATTDGLLPTGITESRFALRLLRAGYVHVYIKSPPPDMKNWLVYRVTKEADLIPEKSAHFAHPKQSAVCKNKRHNVAGLKVLDIPQAHKITDIWIAYSANLWNDKLRDQNKANPKVMQHINLAGGSPNTFKPTAAELKSQVLECALPELRIGATNDHDFKFNNLTKKVDSLAQNLVKAAACHPKTAGKELAVVLRDPVGITAELNALRLHRNAQAQKAIRDELALPENAYALNSSNNLMELKSLYEKAALAKVLEQEAPAITWREYTQPHPATPFNPMGRTLAPYRSKDGVWEALPEETAKGGHLSDNTLGRVWYPNSHRRILNDSKYEAEKTWGKLEKEYSEPDRRKWHSDFDDKIKKDHWDPLALLEKDWWTARLDEKFNQYFEYHFDETDRNDPGVEYCSGLKYCAEVNRATTPEPFTKGLLKDYLNELTADVSKPSAVMLRSLAANQKAVIEKMMETVSVVEKMHENRNDKLYDLGSALVLKTTGPAAAKYRWLAPVLGNIMGGYAIGTVSALDAALSAATAAGFAIPNVASRLLSVSLVQRTTDLALQSIISKTALNTPMLITMRMQAGRAMYLLTRGGYFTDAEAKGFIRDGFIDVVLHTDTDEMRKVGGDAERALLHKAGNVSIPGQYPAAVLVNHAALGATITLTEKKFAELYARGGSKWGSLVNKVKSAYSKMEITGIIMRSLEGRLALGVILLNGKGALKSIDDLSAPNLKDLARLEVELSLTDGVASVVAASLQLTEIVVTSRQIKQLGPNATPEVIEETIAKNASIHALRAGGFMLGALAGGANAWGAFIKAERAKEEGNTGAQYAYYASIGAFFGMSTAFGLQTAGASADLALAKGIENKILKKAAVRMAARYGAASTLSLSGWGTALLALAMVFEVGAIILTPTEMEAWVGHSRFGKNKKNKFKDWEEEKAALEEVMKQALMTDEERAKIKEEEEKLKEEAHRKRQEAEDERMANDYLSGMIFSP